MRTYVRTKFQNLGREYSTSRKMTEILFTLLSWSTQSSTYATWPNVLDCFSGFQHRIGIETANFTYLYKCMAGLILPAGQTARRPARQFAATADMPAHSFSSHKHSPSPSPCKYVQSFSCDRCCIQLDDLCCHSFVLGFRQPVELPPCKLSHPRTHRTC